MRPCSSSPENNNPEPLWWLEGGWPYLGQIPAPTSMIPEAPLSNCVPPTTFEDLIEMPIGEAEDLFLSSQDDAWYGCSESACEDTSDSGEDDYIDENNDCSLEEMLLPYEMRHSVQSLRPPRWRGRRSCQDEGRRARHLHSGDGLREEYGSNNAGLVDVEAGGHSACDKDEEPFRSSGIPANVFDSGDPGYCEGAGGVDWSQGDWASNGWGGDVGAGQGWAGDGGGWDTQQDAVASLGPGMLGGSNRGPRPHVLPTERVHRGSRAPRNFELSDDDHSSESDDDGRAIGDLNGIKHLYRDETWGKESFEYDPPQRAFTRCGGPTFEALHRMPTFLMLFRLFWPDTLLRKICTETNRYATAVDGDRNVPGGRRWRRLSVAGLKVFFVISMLMGLKRQPNMKTYWEREGGFFHCPMISHIFSRDRFQQITKCLHISNPNSYVATRREPRYDKMGQVRRLVDDIRRVRMREWNLGKYVTVDEMMIRKLLPCATVHAEQAREVGSEGVVFGGFEIEVCIQFRNILW
jgi:hypothetical protein